MCFEQTCYPDIPPTPLNFSLSGHIILAEVGRVVLDQSMLDFRMSFRGLLLATLMIASGSLAFAAEPLPVESDASENVKSCDQYGEGFVYIPDTKTCVKISGEVRATYTIK